GWNRMETRLAKKEDLKELKEIWKLCFGDEDSFIDFYFQRRDWVKETAVLVQDGRIASMLTMIPVDIVGEDGGKRRASMLYAIATHPDFRKKGYAEQLIEFSNEYLLSQQVSVTLLVPAGEGLFRFYGKRGYQDGFTIREAVLRREEIEALGAGVPAGAVHTSEPEPLSRQVRAAAVPAERRVTVKPVEPAEYNRIRKNQLTGHSRLDYREEELSFEKQLARMFGTDLYSIETGGAEGCAYVERISEEEVIVKELLIPDQHMAAALIHLSELLPAEKYIVRTPSFAGGILGGSVRPFGMLRINGKDARLVNKASNPVDNNSYLGIAYD
ncbi:MAG TPA: GNAT family N-acetyltransferase, partial [Anaerovoracaceae bacterium]|nr:GNAT family N-acetyltransferase [Anaerovoracaceae bacterium]